MMDRNDTDIPLVFLYARVSTDEQREGHSLKAQSALMESADDAKDAQTILYDDVHTGRNTKRQGLQQMLRDLNLGPAFVLVSRVDRLSRSQPDFWSILRRIQNAGAVLLDLSSGSRSDKPHGRLMLGISAAVAEHESYLISERTSFGVRRAQKEGKHVGSPGYGFQIDDQGEIQSKPEEENHLRLIVDLKRKGHSYHAIAHVLNKENIPTKKGGKKWHASTVRSVLMTAQKLAPWAAMATALAT